MWLVLFLFVGWSHASTTVGRFFNPKDSTTDANGFAGDQVWTIGDVQTINFTTTYTNYTIALWQQLLTQGDSTEGPVIFESTTGDFTNFDWVVQTYTLSLCDSNLFFLWLHSGGDSEQGTGGDLSVTSHHINITDPSGTATCTSATSKTSVTASQSSSTTGSSATTTHAGTAADSDTTGSAVTSESSSEASITGQNTISSTGTSETTATGNKSTGNTATGTVSPTETTNPDPHGGVPTKTIVAIVIGVCLFGVPGLLGCIIYFWRQRKKQKAGESNPDKFLKAGKDDDQGSASTEAHPNAPELDSCSIKGELMAEPFFRGQYQELHERYVKPDLELLAEPFFRDRIQEVHGQSYRPELHSDSCGPELPAGAVIRTRLRESHRRSRGARSRTEPGTEPWAGNWAELGFRAELP